MSEPAAKKSLLCPTCKKPVEATNDDFPFCSDRCRVIDLGKWASGEYRIASPIFDEELLEELQQSEHDQPSPGSGAGKEWKN
jgi:endogenous inhibitor of DNA gyrase (YacG/DUF329 family)